MATEKTEAPKKAAPKKTTKKKAAAKKTSAPKASTKKPEFGFKSAFIKSQPLTMTAKEVVEAAKAKGITLSENLVYAAGASAKGNGGASKKAKGATKAKPGPKPKKAATSKASSSLEATLRNAIAQVGLSRAREILAQVEKAFSGA